MSRDRRERSTVKLVHQDGICFGDFALQRYIKLPIMRSFGFLLMGPGIEGLLLPNRVQEDANCGEGRHGGSLKVVHQVHRHARSIQG